MNQLINIIERNGARLVSAKELHQFLEVKTDFRHWIKRMFEYGFEKSEDFLVVKNDRQKGSGGHNAIDYALTISCAKEISMLQRNEKGKEARKYFIECEKKVKDGIPSMKSMSRKDLALMIIESEEAKEAAERRVALLEPKAQLADKILDSEEQIDIGQAAKILELGFGRNKLFQELRKRGVFFKSRNEPKQIYINKGYFRMTEKWIERNNHDGFVVTKVLVTQKGLDFLAKEFGVLDQEVNLIENY